MKFPVVLRNPYLLVIVAVYVFLIAILAFGKEDIPEEFPAPEFTLDDIMTEGQKIVYSREMQRPALIYFFASW